MATTASRSRASSTSRCSRYKRFISSRFIGSPVLPSDSTRQWPRHFSKLCSEVQDRVPRQHAASQATDPVNIDPSSSHQLIVVPERNASGAPACPRRGASGLGARSGGRRLPWLPPARRLTGHGHEPVRRSVSLRSLDRHLNDVLAAYIAPPGMPTANDDALRPSPQPPRWSSATATRTWICRSSTTDRRRPRRPSGVTGWWAVCWNS